MITKKRLDRKLLSTVAIVLASSYSFADTISVAQGETNDVTTAATITAMEVHGMLRLRGASKTDVAELTFDPGSTAAYLGTASGDNAVIDIGDYGRIKGGKFTFGGTGGVGGFVIGGKRKNNATGVEWDGATAHLVSGLLRVSEDATSDSGVIDILTLNAGASAGMYQPWGQRIINASPNVDARILFNGGYFAGFNAFGTTYLFTTINNSKYPDDVPVGAGGKSIILESVDGNAIDLRFISGNKDTSPKMGDVRFRGAGDVSLYSSGTYGWNWNGPSESWQNNGDLRITGTFMFSCVSNDVLPCAAANGIVQVLGDAPCCLDLKGKNQKVNGLVVSGGSVLTNSGSSVTLTFGAAKPDGVLSVKNVGYVGLITAQKQGDGTLTVTNTPYFPAMKVTEGTVCFKNDDCTLGSLAVNKSTASVVVDGCTLTLNDFDIVNGSAVTCVNGGKLRFSSDASATNVVDAASWNGVMLEKTGSGMSILGSGASTALNGVKVAGGTLAVGAIGSTNRFWRVSIKSSANGGMLALGPFRLYAHNLDTTDGGSTGDGSGTYTDRSSDGITASQLEARQFICSRSDYEPTDDSSASKKHRPPTAMFGAGTVYSCLFKTTPYPSVGNPASWVVMTYRIPDTAAATFGYDVKAQWEGVGAYPGTWTLESSPDGTDGSWEVMDEKSGRQARDGQYWYNGDVRVALSTKPYVIPKVYAGGGFAAAANVQVDRGATLDCSHVTGGQTLSNLTVDCSAGEGDGTLVNVVFAASGTINLVNLPEGMSLKNYGLPLVFVDASATVNVHNWTVCVNGAPVRHKVTYQNGRLIFIPAGTIMIMR